VLDGSAPASRDRRWTLAAIALALLAFVALVYIGRGIGFFYDEWTFVLTRRAWTADAFLQPHNEHIVVLPVLVYKLLFEVVGLSSHWPYRILPVALHAAIGITVFLLARSRVGGPAALIASALVLVMGRTAQNLLWAFQIGFLGSVLGGLLAMLALDRGRKVAASIALVAAMLCSGLGIPFALGVTAEQLAGRRARALWVPGVPLGIYAIWWLGYGRGTSHITADSASQAAEWGANTAAAAAGSVVGLTIDWGRVLLVLLVAALLVHVVREQRGTPRLAGLIVTAVSFWGLSGMLRSLTVDPAASRYLTLGAVIIVLVVTELLRGVPMTSRALILGGLLVVFAGIASLPTLRGYAKDQRRISGIIEAELGAVQLRGPSGPRAFRVDPTYAPQLMAGPFLDAVRDEGSSPADTPSELAQAFNAERQQADRVLQGTALSAAPATGAVPASCRRLTATPVERTVPAAGLLLDGRGHAAVRVRRFADDVVNPPSPVPVAGPTVLRFAPDRSPVPYRVQVSVVDGIVRLCG